MTLSLSDVTGKQTSSMVVETFDWCHVMTTAVERNGPMRRLITFFHRVVCKLYTKSLKIMHKTVVKNVNIKNEFHIFWGSSKYECNGSHAKVKVTLFGRHLLCTGPIAFILWWTSEKWNLFLNEFFRICLLIPGATSSTCCDLFPQTKEVLSFLCVNWSWGVYHLEWIIQNVF